MARAVSGTSDMLFKSSTFKEIKEFNGIQVIRTVDVDVEITRY